MAKVVVRGMFREIMPMFSLKERFQVNDLTLHLKELEKEQTNPKDKKIRA